MRYSTTIVTFALLAANVSIAAPTKRGMQALDGFGQTIDSAGGAVEGIVGTAGGTLVVVSGARPAFAGLSGGGIEGTVAQTAGAVESALTNVLGTGIAGVGGLLSGGGLERSVMGGAEGIPEKGKEVKRGAVFGIGPALTIVVDGFSAVAGGVTDGVGGIVSGVGGLVQSG